VKDTPPGFYFKGDSMAYTPELSLRSSCTLRRIAWALDMPMTLAIESVFETIPKIVDRKKVCEKCLDRSICASCAFLESGQCDI
jgi:hypothetical protein